MPILIAIVILSLVAGVIHRPGAVYVFCGMLGVLANFAFVWAIADGKGNDPWWLILLSLAAAGVFAAAWVGLAARRKLGAGSLRVN